MRTAQRLAACVALFCFASTAQEVHSAEKPNFVIIMADDMGYADPSCYGNDRYQTPSIDRLAREGLRFTDFHSSGNVCSPTRAGLITGRYQQRAGVPGVITAANHRTHGLFPTEVTFAEILKEAGYATAISGKWHLGYQTKFNPRRHGFDHFWGYVSGNVDYFSHIDQTGVYDWWHDEKLVKEPGYSTYLITQHAVDFIRDNRDRPFCLYVAHEAPHYPLQGPNDKAERVEGEAKVRGGRTDRAAAYAEMVVAMDEGVGQILDTLKELKLEENTLVWFFSDNGGTSLANNGPLRGTKGSNWEGGHRVPGIARWPGHIAPGSTTDQLSITLDVMPTLLDYTGTSVPSGHKLDGVSLRQLLEKGEKLPNRQLAWNGKALRDGNWKLIVNGKQGKQGAALYDLAKDIGEQQDLAAEMPDRVQKMRAALAAWEKDVADGATQQPELPQK